MGSFFTSGPTPPVDIPKISIPPPDKKTVGDFWAGFWKPIMDWLGSNVFVSWVVAVVNAVQASVIGNLLALTTWIATKLAQGIMDGRAIAGSPIEQLARLAIKDAFGVDVTINTAAGRGAGGANTGAASSIGDAAMRGLFGFTGAAGGGTITPSQGPAAAYMSKMIQMSLEGWVDKFMAEILSLGQLESMGGLDEKLINAMGLRTISSRIMGPLADATVATPFEWHINKTFRPRLLSASQAAKLYRATIWTRAQFEEEMARQGFSNERMEAFLQENARYFSDTELDLLVSSGRWQFGQAVQHLVEQGHTEEQGRAIMELQEQRRLDPYRRKYADVGADAFVAGKIDLGEWQRILELSKLPERERNMLRLLTGLRKELVRKQISMSDVEQAVKRQILNINDYRKYLRDEGYSDNDARVLELLLLFDIRTANDAAAARQRLAEEREAARLARLAEQEARRARVEAELAVKEISLSQMEQLVRRGLRTIEDYRALLRANKYAGGDVEDLAELLASKIEDAAAAIQERERLRREAAVRNVSLADFEAAVKRDLASLDDYRRFLDGQEFAPESAELMVRLLADEIDDAIEAARLREESEALLAIREVSLADVEKGVRRGFLSMEQYIEFLAKEGFEESRISLLVQLVQSDIDADGEARDRRAAAEAKAAQKQISLSDLERAVRAGIRKLSDYRAELSRLGFGAADQDALERLLQLQIDGDKAAAKKREEAAAKLAIRRVSLADVERAVKLGVTGMESYRRLLEASGFPAEDRQLLAGTLLAEVAATAHAKQERERARALLARRGLSLAQFERAVRGGLQTVESYEGFLVGQGYAGGDARTLASLLRMQIEQDRQAQALRAAKEAEVRTRNLTLATWESAVKAGVRRMDEYRGFLVDQNFVPEDVATLIALLVGEIEAELAEA